jgi:hypothetical protein
MDKYKDVKYRYSFEDERELIKQSKKWTKLYATQKMKWHQC